MPWRNIAITKAPDDADGNEQFYIVRHDPSRDPLQPGYVQETKGPLPEALIRSFLQTFGQAPHEVDEMFERARAK